MSDRDRLRHADGPGPARRQLSAEAAHLVTQYPKKVLAEALAVLRHERGLSPLVPSDVKPAALTFDHGSADVAALTSPPAPRLPLLPEGWEWRMEDLGYDRPFAVGPPGVAVRTKWRSVVVFAYPPDTEGCDPSSFEVPWAVLDAVLEASP